MHQTHQYVSNSGLMALVSRKRCHSPHSSSLVSTTSDLDGGHSIADVTPC